VREVIGPVPLPINTSPCGRVSLPVPPYATVIIPDTSEVVSARRVTAILPSVSDTAVTTCPVIGLSVTSSLPTSY
jgi:hypothetical protein